MEGIRIAANLGGDCDTNASIVGGICGAIAGRKAFPKEWIDAIESVNQLGLRSYAESLSVVASEIAAQNKIGLQ